MKVKAGSLAPPHAHENLEQIYVLGCWALSETAVTRPS